MSSANPAVDAASARFRSEYPDPEANDDVTIVLNALVWPVYSDEAVSIAAALIGNGPEALPDPTPLQALALAVTLINAERARPMDGDSIAVQADAVRRHTVAVVETEQEAASLAVRLLGGPLKASLPVWAGMALDDEDNDAPVEIIRRAALSCANTAPGMRWAYLWHGLGWVLYRRN